MPTRASGSLRAFQLPNLGVVIDKLLDSGVKAIGFDQIYTTTAVDQFVRGYDRPFLLALSKGRRTAASFWAKPPIAADPALYRADLCRRRHRQPALAQPVGRPDGVIRRLPSRCPTSMLTAKAARAGMSLELAARAGGKPSPSSPTARSRLGDTLSRSGKRLSAGSPALARRLAHLFDRRSFDCAKAGRDDYFRESVRRQDRIAGPGTRYRRSPAQRRSLREPIRLLSSRTLHVGSAGATRSRGHWCLDPF